YQYLVRALQLSHVNPSVFLPYKPWHLAGLWGIYGYSGVTTAYGVGAAFFRCAGCTHKGVGGVGAGGAYIAGGSGMSGIESELLLLDSITRYNKNLKHSDYDRLHRAWRHGDMNTLWALEQRFQAVNPGGDVRLLPARNVKWVPRIRAEISSGKPTAVVCG